MIRVGPLPRCSLGDESPRKRRVFCGFSGRLRKKVLNAGSVFGSVSRYCTAHARRCLPRPSHRQPGRQPWPPCSRRLALGADAAAKAARSGVWGHNRPLFRRSREHGRNSGRLGLIALVAEPRAVNPARRKQGGHGGQHAAAWAGWPTLGKRGGENGQESQTVTPETERGYVLAIGARFTIAVPGATRPCGLEHARLLVWFAPQQVPALQRFCGEHDLDFCNDLRLPQESLG